MVCRCHNEQIQCGGEITSIAKFTVPIVATVFLGHRIALYRISVTLTIDNGSQFVSEFLAALCFSVWSILATTIENYANAIGQVEKFNKTFFAQLLQYIHNHETDWDLFMQLIIDDYSIEDHFATKTSPFSLILSRGLLGAFIWVATTAKEESQLSHAQAELKTVKQYLHLKQQEDAASQVLEESKDRNVYNHMQHH